MAYDSNSTYEAPRRPYYGQQQQQQRAPAQNGYKSKYYQQQNDGYSQQLYDQGFDQQYDQYNGYGQEMNQDWQQQQQPPQVSDRYDGGYQDRNPQPMGQATRHDQAYQGQERQYDPRYQQRPDRGRQRSDEQQQRQRQPPPPQQQSKQPRPQANRAEQPYQIQQARPNPRMARQYPGDPPIQNQPPRQPAPELVAPPKTNGNAASRPQTAPRAEKKFDPARTLDPAKTTMEEWKAKERARMHAEALSPEVLAQDNAFPVFPTKRERSRPGTANRERDEDTRPATATGERRPSAPRKNSHNTEASSGASQQIQPPRPSIEHKPASFDTSQARPAAQQSRSPPAQSRPQFERQSPNNVVSPRNEPPQQPWQQPEHSRSPPAMQVDRRPLPPQPNGYNQVMEPQKQYQELPAPQQSRQPRPRPSMQPINTWEAQAQQPPRPAYMDHQPLSPAHIPPRPSTAQAQRMPISQPLVSPTSPLAQSQTTYYGGQAPPQSAYTAPEVHELPAQVDDIQQVHELAGSMDDVYSGHDASRVPPPVTAPAWSRDEEIEAEMPDFDSAAPGGFSMLHKRNQTVDKHLNGNPAPAAAPPPMPPLARQQTDMSAMSAPIPTQTERFYSQQQDQSSVSLPQQRMPVQKQGGITNGFAFGFSEDQAQQQQYYDGQQQQMPQQPQQRMMNHQQQQRPLQPREHRPRRSMDDARQMPYQQGPPPQQHRMHQNGQPPRGQYPPQQRPVMDRNLTAQTAQTSWSEPGPQGAMRPPQERQRLQEPLHRPPDGLPLTQQRSALERQGPLQAAKPRQYSNPDQLPQHPTPVRPGLMESAPSQVSRAPTTRNYENAALPSSQRQASVKTPPRPVTTAELNQLQAAVEANPTNYKQAMVLVKKLVEASTVLVSESARADPKIMAKNRERYIMDAHKRLKKLVAAGYAEAQFYLADCYSSGDLGLEPDTKEAFNLYQAAAKAGHAQAAYRTAFCCEMGAGEGGGTRQDYAKAVQWYRRAATLGDASGMYKLGIILLKGLLGQQRNVGESVTWLKRACDNTGEQENPHAMHELATLYESSNANPEVRNKVVADDGYALELFQRAAKGGHKLAQFRLGQAYEYGQLGVTIDNRTSIAWYSKAAAQGEHQAELALSGWYLTGAEGILEHSDMEAYLWARKAASSEPPLAKAMFAMGYFTETGIGCPASLEEARKWYARAACKLSTLHSC